MNCPLGFNHSLIFQTHPAPMTTWQCSFKRQDRPETEQLILHNLILRKWITDKKSVQNCTLGDCVSNRFQSALFSMRGYHFAWTLSLPIRTTATGSPMSFPYDCMGRVGRPYIRTCNHNEEYYGITRLTDTQLPYLTYHYHLDMLIL